MGVYSCKTRTSGRRLALLKLTLDHRRNLALMLLPTITLITSWKISFLPLSLLSTKSRLSFALQTLIKADEAGTRIIMTHLPSGQSHEQECFVDKKERNAQATGGCYTYAKRYLLSSLFLISDPKLDDDGDHATHGNRKKTAAKPKVASDDVIAKIKKDLADFNIPEDKALEKVGAKTWVITNEQATIIQGRIDQLRSKK
tara:strand:+ start:660 stop:1259 length:600 start_codon:yes stop_codon:yes gene_type:complete